MRYVSYGFSLLSNLAHTYRSSSLEIKQKLVGLIFPEKLTYQNSQYRTTAMSEVLAVFCGNSEGIGTNKKGLTAESGNQSYLAPQVRFELTTLRLTAGCSTIELLRNSKGCKYKLLSRRGKRKDS